MNIAYFNHSQRQQNTPAFTAPPALSTTGAWLLSAWPLCPAAKEVSLPLRHTYTTLPSTELFFNPLPEPKFESDKNNVENTMSNVCSKSHKALLGQGPSKYPSHWMLAILGWLILSIHVLFFKLFCDKSKTNVQTLRFFVC